MLLPTLLAACYNAERACEAVEQFISYDCLIGFLEDEEAAAAAAAAAALDGSSTGSSSGSEAGHPPVGAARAGARALFPAGDAAGGGAVPAYLLAGGSISNGAGGLGSAGSAVGVHFRLSRRFPAELLQDAKDYFKSRAECCVWMNGGDDGSASSSSGAGGGDN